MKKLVIFAKRCWYDSVDQVYQVQKINDSVESVDGFLDRVSPVNSEELSLTFYIKRKEE